MGFKLGKNKVRKTIDYKYFPKNHNELKNIIREHIDNGVNDFNDIDVSNIEVFWNAFEYCVFEEINVSKWDLTKAKELSGMFYGCSNLKKIDVSNWDVSGVENMAFMFDGCSELKSIDVKNWNTKNLKVTKYMFYKCEKLQQIDISNWDVSNIINMDKMFAFCKNLLNVGNIDNFDSKFKSSRIQISKMFNNTHITPPDWYSDNINLIR